MLVNIEKDLEQREATLAAMKKRAAQGIGIDGYWVPGQAARGLPPKFMQEHRCTRCGNTGHNKSSRRCPLYKDAEEDTVAEDVRDAVVRDGTVKQHHRGSELKLTIDMSKATAHANFAQPVTLKIDTSKTQDGLKAKEELDHRDFVTRKNLPQQARIGRKAGSPLVKLNELLANVLKDLCRQGSCYEPFVRPAAEAAGPFYLRVISSPMGIAYHESHNARSTLPTLHCLTVAQYSLPYQTCSR